jgi:hypothetical protein
MTSKPQRSSATCWALLLVLIAILLGHVCVLPVHAHASPATTHQHGDESDPAADATHIASCEAVTSSPVARPLPVAARTVEYVPVALAVTTWLAADRVAATPPRSMPLFLLHAALLI